ncbi:hypothetical protein GCM10027093_68790 [Paraburkholderia jirisanensis]
MWKDFQLEQHYIMTSTTKQPVGSEVPSINDAVRNIQASMNAAAKGGYPSEWLFASVNDK